jgi:DNA-binding transcriptional ArsR family regulator
MTMAQDTPRLTRSVHRDLLEILVRWPDYFKMLSSEAFALLVILEALRLRKHGPDRLNCAELADELGVSANTLRRWMGVLRKKGLLSTRFVPGTHSMEATFQITLRSRSMPPETDGTSAARPRR